MIRKNDQFLLKLQIPDRLSDLFVRAFIFDETMTLAGFSPKNLTHKQNGLYYDISQQATTIGNYTVQYIVYNDAGYTDISKKYASVDEDVFVFDFDQNILTAVQGIPTNPLLTVDSRLDNLGLIPDKLDTSVFSSGKTEIMDTVNNNTDDSDGRAV